MSLYRRRQDNMMILLTLTVDKEEIVKNLVGRKIKAVRPMTRQEMDEEGWVGNTVVIELDDGSVLFPSADEEGNSSGTLFGKDKNGTRSVYVP